MINFRNLMSINNFLTNNNLRFTKKFIACKYFLGINFNLIHLLWYILFNKFIFVQFLASVENVQTIPLFLMKRASIFAISVKLK